MNGPAPKLNINITKDSAKYRGSTREAEMKIEKITRTKNAREYRVSLGAMDFLVSVYRNRKAMVIARDIITGSRPKTKIILHRKTVLTNTILDDEQPGDTVWALIQIALMESLGIAR